MSNARTAIRAIAVEAMVTPFLEKLKRGTDPLSMRYQAASQVIDDNQDKVVEAIASLLDAVPKGNIPSEAFAEALVKIREINAAAVAPTSATVEELLKNFAATCEINAAAEQIKKTGGLN